MQAMRCGKATFLSKYGDGNESVLLWFSWAKPKSATKESCKLAANPAPYFARLSLGTLGR